MASATTAKIEQKIPYDRLLTFIDVMYSAVLSYGLYLFSERLKPMFEGKPTDKAALGLLSFVMLYLIGDYIDARLYTERFPYRGLSRFLIDLIIAFAFFLAYVAAWEPSALSLVFLAVVSGLGAVWVVVTYFECKAPIKYKRLLVAAHVAFAAVLMWRFYDVHSKSMNGHEVIALWRDYAVVGCSYVALEILNKIPSVEADLFPTFPIGRIARLLVKLLWPTRELP